MKGRSARCGLLVSESKLRAHQKKSTKVNLVPETGIEPATFALRVRCSTG